MLEIVGDDSFDSKLICGCFLSGKKINHLFVLSEFETVDGDLSCVDIDEQSVGRCTCINGDRCELVNRACACACMH